MFLSALCRAQILVQSTCNHKKSGETTDPIFSYKNTHYAPDIEKNHEPVTLKLAIHRETHFRKYCSIVF